MIRTSETHPIQIAAIDEGPDRGRIGVTFAPGKNDRFAIGGPWARDLDKDLDAIVAWDAKAVVTLLETHELAHLAITRLGAEVQRRGMELLHLPIPDVSTPGPEFDAKWSEISKYLRARLDAGENIIIHCRGGPRTLGHDSGAIAGGVRRRSRGRNCACSRHSAWGDRDMGTRAMGEMGTATSTGSMMDLAQQPASRELKFGGYIGTILVVIVVKKSKTPWFAGLACWGITLAHLGSFRPKFN